MASVITLVADRRPPPLATANATVVPDTGFAYASVTATTSGLPTAVVTGLVWLFPEISASWAGAPVVPVDENVTEDNSPADEAVTVLTPVVVPTVSVVRTLPSISLIPVEVDRVPPPLVTANATVTPDSGL